MSCSDVNLVAMRKITVNANHVASVPIGLTRGVRLPLSEHLRTCSEMDIAPDTVPCNGTTTTAEAFISCVPVVTPVGDRHVRRVGHSMLSCAGLLTLVASTVDGYITLAIALTHDRAGLHQMHASIRDTFIRSEVCNGDSFVRECEGALGFAWRAACARQSVREP